MAIISKGIQLYFIETTSGKKPSWSTGSTASESGYLIPNLQEIGELSAAVGGSRDQIEVTTLADDKHVYEEGLLAENSASGIDFKFLFNPTDYLAFEDLIKEEQSATKGGPSKYKVLIPQGGAFTIEGYTAVKLDSVGVNSAVTMTVSITPSKAITYAYTTV